MYRFIKLKKNYFSSNRVKSCCKTSSPCHFFSQTKLFHHFSSISQHSVPVSSKIFGWKDFSSIFQIRNFSTQELDEERVKKIRNIGIIAHVDAGKTTTAECMIYYCGQNRSIGDVDDGNTVMDYLQMERERGITIQSAAITLPWKEHRINLIDTPGHIDFTMEVERSIRVLDGAVAIFDAVAGVQAQSETVWKQANRYQVPRVVYLNKLDRMGASVERSLNSMRNKLNANPLLIQYPVGDSNQFSGVIDLLTMKQISWSGKWGGEITIKEIEPKFKENATKAKILLLEQLSELDEQIMEKFLDEKEIDIFELKQVIRKLTLNHKITPVLCGSSLNKVGVQPLLDAIIDYLPSPIDKPPVEGKKKNGEVVKIPYQISGSLCALAYKVIYDHKKGLIVFFRVYSGVLNSGIMIYNINKDKKERAMKLFQVSADDLTEISQVKAGDIGAVMGLKSTSTGDTLTSSNNNNPVMLQGILSPPPVFFCSVEPQTAADEENLTRTLELLQLEDPSFHVSKNEESGQTLLSGMGELHLEIIRDRILNFYNVAAEIGKICISYKSSIQNETQVTHSTTHSQNGRTIEVSITLTLKPMNEKNSVQFKNLAYTNESTQKKNQAPSDIQSLVNSIKEGFERSCMRGFYGYPLVGIEGQLDHFEAPTTEITSTALRKCIAQLINKALNDYGTILEPIVSMEMSVPDKYVGAILTDLSSHRRASIKEITVLNEETSDKLILADVPLKEVIGYSSILRSISQGTAHFTIQFSEYQPMDSLQKELILKELKGLV